MARTSPACPHCGHKPEWRTWCDIVGVLLGIYLMLCGAAVVATDLRFLWAPFRLLSG